MNLIAAVVLAAVAMLIVTYPLFRRPEEEVVVSGGKGGSEPVPADLVSRREAVYLAIRDLDFDHSIGNLSDEDYRSMRENLKQEAMGVLKEIDAARTGKVAVARRESGAQVEDGAQRPRPKGRPRRTEGSPDGRAGCPACGHVNREGDKFCRGCGVSLALTCPSCGAPCAEDERFCARCGAALKGGRRG